jgi:hypothetical protein
VEEAQKIFIPFLFFLVLIVSLQVIEYLRRRARRRKGDLGPAALATERMPERLRFPPGPGSPSSPGTATPAPPPRPLVSASAPPAEPTSPAAASATREGVRRAPPVRATAPMPSGPSARVRIRRLLRDPGGRRAAILAHENLRPPPGLEAKIAERNVPEVERI